MDLFVAFTAGVLSFLSPCVIPLIPGYLSFMTGLNSSELADADRPMSRVLVPAALFVLGFSLVFVAFGATASALGQVLGPYRDEIEKVGAVAIIAFGILMLGIIKLPWLYGEARFEMGKTQAFGTWGSLVMGMAFAAGWTPCVGPILGTILALAASTADVGRGVMLLFTYSLGLGLPFMAVALLFGRMGSLLRWFNRHSLVLNRIAGVLLIVMGVLILTGRLSAISAWAIRYLPSVDVLTDQLPKIR